MDAGFRRQVRRRRADRLHAGLLIIRDDGHRVAWLLRAGRSRFQDLDLFVNAQDLRHFFFEFRITALQVVAYLVRLHGMRVENFAYGPLQGLVQRIN